MQVTMDLNVLGIQPREHTMQVANTASGSDGSFAQILSSTQSSIGATNYDSYFEAAAETYNIPVNLLKAVAKAESSFNANAVSSCGAQGLMQLMPSTARSLGVTNAFDPEQNIMGGAKCLRQMLDMFDGNVSYALAAYNAGPGAVQKYGGIPPYTETQNYVSKVLSYAGDGTAVSDGTNRLASAAGDVVESVTGSSALASAAENVVNALTGDSSALDSLSSDELQEIWDTLFSDDSSDVGRNQLRLLMDQILFRYLNRDEHDENESEREDSISLTAVV